jgi:GTP:adenosylcobinamide-phosphate guanylyltransferase
MIPALLIGRGGSRGVPGKNVMKILGRPLMAYPILAAKHSSHITHVFLSTDDARIRAVGRAHGAELIDRPAQLATDQALVEDVVVHGHAEIERRLGPVEVFVLLFCNAATIRPGLLDEGIELLLSNPSLDSAVSVSLYNEYSPVRARRIDAEGLLRSYVDVGAIPGASCDRDSAEPCWFCDCSAWVLRRRCMDLGKGHLPFRWTGERVAPLYQQGGLDVDHEYGLAHTAWWLSAHGFTGARTPYDPPSAAAASRGRRR